jgi:nucleoside-diphosphate-sugar epimerase
VRTLVTGATGLIGANVCELLRARGDDVVALVRDGSDATALVDLGVEIARGDITVVADVDRASDGVDVIVNSAALLGGPGQSLADQLAANHLAALSCYDAARRGGFRVVELSTTPFLRRDRTLTERPELLDEAEIGDDPYAISKGRAFRDGLQRVSAGEDIVFVIPGGTFGPSPVVKRAMAITSFNRLVRAAILGHVSEFPAFPVPWVLASDVAQAVIGAIDRGVPGVAYIAFGREEMTTATFLDLACRLAGVAHRVADVVLDPGDEAFRAQYGETMFDMATRVWPTPTYDNSETLRVLDLDPTPIEPGLVRTIAWLRDEGWLG